MANIALGKKPLESEWISPEEATNGIITGYSGEKGFSHANYPINYTLDLGKSIRINTIRFLLWDGLGSYISSGISRIKDKRQYYYSLSLSQDNETWDTYYTTRGQGFNGWQVFQFAKNIEARFVRLHGKYNTKNDAIHLVEFEVHDNTPPAIINASITNTQFLIEPLIDNNLFVNKLQDFINKNQKEISTQYSEIVDKLKQDAIAVEKLRAELTNKIDEFNKTILQLNLVGKSLNFQQESIKLNSSSKKWLIGSILSFALFLVLLFTLLYSKNLHFMEISKEVSKGIINNMDLVNKTILFEFISYLILKSLLVSLSIYAIVFCVKNYRAQKHNYTINQHKAMSLFASVELLDNEKLSSVTKEQILIQATNTIFSHQHSGYNANDTDVNPNILTTSIDQIKDGLGKK